MVSNPTFLAPNFQSFLSLSPFVDSRHFIFLFLFAVESSDFKYLSRARGETINSHYSSVFFSAEVDRDSRFLRVKKCKNVQMYKSWTRDREFQITRGLRFRPFFGFGVRQHAHLARICQCTFSSIYVPSSQKN